MLIKFNVNTTIIWLRTYSHLNTLFPTAQNCRPCTEISHALFLAQSSILHRKYGEILFGCF